MQHDNGLTKLMEECGELIQAAAKQAARIDFDVHPKGRNMKIWLEEEMADVAAAILVVTENFHLDEARIYARTALKYEEFKSE